MEKAYKRPRVRRARINLDCCQDCLEKLGDHNWSPSMRGEKGNRPRYICKTCWTNRQKKYESGKCRIELNAQNNALRKERESKWTDERRNAEKRRRYNSWLKRKYGISIDDYESMLSTQGGSCKICKTTEPRGKGTFHVDHCHGSGKVRALLCTECNMMLGLAKDNRDTLLAAIDYLDEHS